LWASREGDAGHLRVPLAEMDHQDDNWRQTVKIKLKPLRDRLVHRLGGTMPEPPPRGITYDQLVDLLYPTLPRQLRREVDEAAAGDLSRVSTIRKMLGTIEHQVAPTTFSVQLTEADAVQCTVGGVELFCDAADAAVTPGLLSGDYEPHLTAVFHRYCQPGMTVVDVGANLGYYSLLAAGLVGSSGKVIALEPNSENCRLMLSSLRLHGTTNVDLLPIAADSTTGWAYYSTHVGSNGGLIDDGELLARPGVVVPTFRLDDIVDGPVGLLKMDVEGAEGRVVEGAARLIEGNRPIVTTELKDEMLRRVSRTTVADYLGYFEGIGYTPSLLEKATGAEKPYSSVADLLADWGEADELRDVLLLPRTA
jgi:FkbM family methyltransferase